MGKTVAVPNGPVTVTDTTVSQGTINLPSGANGIQIQVLDGTGSVVRTMTMGAQTPGDVTINWDGKDAAGNNVANGSSYRYSVMANVNGKSTNPTVSTYAAVTGVSSTGTSDGGYLLQVQGGQTINLSNVTKVSN
jgi:flagellar basal-body rod modification protein FlgD